MVILSIKNVFMVGDLFQNITVYDKMSRNHVMGKIDLRGLNRSYISNDGEPWIR